jgi:hypothetical protein
MKRKELEKNLRIAGCYRTPMRLPSTSVRYFSFSCI